MDRVVDGPKVVGGSVWITVRIAGHRFAVGAVRPGEWALYEPPPPTSPDWDKASALASAWARDNADALAPLFAEAEAFRNALKP
jgi:hypothetical protein